MRSLTPVELEQCFPKLRDADYSITSKATARYNCVAFANDDERHFWDPSRYGSRYYWPPDIPRNYTLDAWTKMFSEQGYEPTDSRKHEPGYEKVAIYYDQRRLEPTHVARSDGVTWKSKLGSGVDIHHAFLDPLEGIENDEYGRVELVMKRPRKDLSE